jgi:hypothetical protein
MDRNEFIDNIDTIVQNNVSDGYNQASLEECVGEFFDQLQKSSNSNYIQCQKCGSNRFIENECELCGFDNS